MILNIQISTFLKNVVDFVVENPLNYILD